MNAFRQIADALRKQSNPKVEACYVYYEESLVMAHYFTCTQGCPPKDQPCTMCSISKQTWFGIKTDRPVPTKSQIVIWNTLND